LQVNAVESVARTVDGATPRRRAKLLKFIRMLISLFKEAALAKTTPLNGEQARFRPPDELVRFLKPVEHRR
jgi:hypothetical protein